MYPRVDRVNYPVAPSQRRALGHDLLCQPHPRPHQIQTCRKSLGEEERGKARVTPVRGVGGDHICSVRLAVRDSPT
jgi:hypothetical protein